jgi:biopolymer transport protein ExbD
MKLKLLIATALLCMAFPAAAEFTTVEKAYELALSDVRLPRNNTGTIAFKECDSCDYMTVRVGADTRYMLNGKAVPLKKFREALSVVENSDDQLVTVLRHVEQNKVTAVLVTLRG